MTYQNAEGFEKVTLETSQMKNYLKRFISFGLDLILALVVGPGTCKELSKVKSNHIT